MDAVEGCGRRIDASAARECEDARSSHRGFRCWPDLARRPSAARSPCPAGCARYGSGRSPSSSASARRPAHLPLARIPPTHLGEHFELRMLLEMRHSPNSTSTLQGAFRPTIASRRAISRENPLEDAFGGTRIGGCIVDRFGAVTQTTPWQRRKVFCSSCMFDGSTANHSQLLHGTSPPSAMCAANAKPTGESSPLSQWLGYSM